MKVNEVAIWEDADATKIRFQKPSKSAMLNGKPADPKKILLKIKKALVKATDMKWIMIINEIKEKEYWARFVLHPDSYGNKEDVHVQLTVGVNWANYITPNKYWIEKPEISCSIQNSHDEMKLFHIHLPMTDETIKRLWYPMAVHTIHEYVTEESWEDEDEDDEDDDMYNVNEASARFRKPAKTALYNDKPEDPKKILMLMKKALNETTGYNFKLKVLSIRSDLYEGQFTYSAEWTGPNTGSTDVVINLDVDWHRDATIRKPMVEAHLSVGDEDRFQLFKYRVDLCDETIESLWLGGDTQQHIAYAIMDATEDAESDDNINEVAARFQKGSDTAWLDGAPANPKKVLSLMQKSLNTYTGFNWKMTPTRIRKHRYDADFTYEGTTIKVEVMWESEYGSRESTIDQPSVVAVNNGVQGYERRIFVYYLPMKTNKIKQLWQGNPAQTVINAVEARRRQATLYRDNPGLSRGELPQPVPDDWNPNED